tara:strand:+ start:241 stop:837 length:597 start_codon:yes stop_codon:yes gene_type:complete
MINKIKKRIKSFKAIPPEKNLPQAAVLIALTNEKDPKILYTLRSNKLSSHSGEVSFPGGKYEEGDENLVDTALRESHEEIGLKRSEVNILGSLDSMVSRFNISVTPFVGIISKETKTNSDSEEIEVCFKVPLSFLLDDKRLRNDAVRRGNETFYVPAYSFKTYVIWGLTAMITVNFLNSALDAGIDLKNPAEILGEKE